MQRKAYAGEHAGGKDRIRDDKQDIAYEGHDVEAVFGLDGCQNHRVDDKCEHTCVLQDAASQESLDTECVGGDGRDSDQDGQNHEPHQHLLCACNFSRLRNRQEIEYVTDEKGQKPSEEEGLSVEHQQDVPQRPERHSQHQRGHPPSANAFPCQ